jgi:hypothetical protein
MRSRMRTLDYFESADIAAVRAAFRLRAAVGSLRAPGPRYPRRETRRQWTPLPLVLVDGLPALNTHEVTRQVQVRPKPSLGLRLTLALFGWCLFVLWSGVLFRVG